MTTGLSVAERLQQRDLLDVAASCAKDHHVPLDAMLGRSREMPLPIARGRFYAYLRALGWSYPAIGKLVGRDHTTVLSQVRRYGVKGA